jgi:Resolvase, N terminal domain
MRDDRDGGGDLSAGEQPAVGRAEPGAGPADVARAQGEVVTWFRDKFTGTSMDRPGLERLLVDVRSGEINNLVEWWLDRLGRTAKASYRAGRASTSAHRQAG